MVHRRRESTAEERCRCWHRYAKCRPEGPLFLHTVRSPISERPADWNLSSFCVCPGRAITNCVSPSLPLPMYTRVGVLLQGPLVC